VKQLKVETVSRAKVPAKARVSRYATRMAQADRVIERLRTNKGKAVAVTPDDGESQRALRLQLQRAALRADVTIATTFAYGKVYLTLVADKRRKPESAA
jgi:hypothetical protein